MEREEVRDAQIAVAHAPIQERQAGATVFTANGMSEATAHGEARDRREQEQQEPCAPGRRQKRRQRLASRINQRS
ncbi:MAG: hypothetical protein IPG50_27440 [Myxococcales bacterium]|nr:hypothetical protein [Myxococcales bacterium]